MILLSSADFIQNLTFSKNSFRNTRSESQMAWIQIRINVLSVMNWVQTEVFAKAICADTGQVHLGSSRSGRI